MRRENSPRTMLSHGYSPEHAQQPIVDPPEDASHVYIGLRKRRSDRRGRGRTKAGGIDRSSSYAKQEASCGRRRQEVEGGCWRGLSFGGGKYLRDGERCGGRGALWKGNYCWRSDVATQARRTGVRLKMKSDLYNGGSRRVTSATGKLCAPASGRRGRKQSGDGDGG